LTKSKEKRKMESVMETEEKVLLEKELNELMEVTFRMEYELEAVIQKSKAQ
jgi:hypothetical protein